MTYKEIGDIVNSNEMRVENILHFSIRKLKRRLAKTYRVGFYKDRLCEKYLDWGR